MTEIGANRVSGLPDAETTDDQPSPTARIDTPQDETSDDRIAPRPVAEPHERARESHWLSFFLVATAIVVLDQISKRYIDANLALGDSWPDAGWPVRIMHVKNTGAAFSMLQNQTLFLTVMSVVGLGAILLYFVYRPSDHPLLRFALALQLGGAVGNLIDRARYGEVTDFIKAPYWPVFNVADSAITIGVTMVILLLLFGGDGARAPAKR